MKYLFLILIPFLFSCSKNQEQTPTKTIGKQIDNEDIPFFLDLNDDGLSDIKISGETSFSASTGIRYELYIQGINGSSICFQTKQDSTWFINVFDGSYDTVYNYNTFLQPLPFSIGDEINSQMNTSNELLTIYHKFIDGTTSIPSSGINRTKLINGNFQYYSVNTSTGLHWLKIKPEIPKTTLYSYSTVSASPFMIIVE